MTRNQFGWGALILGAGVQTAEGLAHADATLNNLQYEETAIGRLLGPVETVLPVSLGWTLIIAGSVALWFIPWVQRGR